MFERFERFFKDSTFTNTLFEKLIHFFKYQKLTSN